MTSIRTLAADFDAQPYEIAAALDLGRDYDETAQLDEDTAVEYREILTISAQVAAGQL